MRGLSIRWKLVLPTMALATLVALLLVALQNSCTRDQLLRQLERTLTNKCEELHTVLASPAMTADLQAFLEIETRYLSSPHEYFYELVDGRGATVMASRNLSGAHLAAQEPLRPDSLLTVPHPLRPGERLRMRCERLSASVAGREAPLLAVALSLGPFEDAVLEGLQQSLLAAGAGLAGLFATLWFVVGRTLRRVSGITSSTATITSTNLRERLPVNGSGDELDQLALVFNEMLTGLSRALEQMEAFTSDAAHQLRTPLTRVCAELDLILCEGGLPRDVRLRLEESRAELDRLAHTCSRLLLLARLDRGALDEYLLSEDVDLRSTVEDLVEQVQRLGAERGVEVRCTGCEDIRVRCNPPLVMEALLNLLDNALRFSSAGQTIEVSLRRSGNEVRITIADQGPGIPEELREQVFRRFFRHAADPSDGGTGLGLSIVRGIARAHGGDVHAEGSPAGGASFVLTLQLGRRPRSGGSDPAPALVRAG